MKATKDNYKTHDIVICTKCNKQIEAQDMLRYRDYIYCDDCIYDVAHLYYSHRADYDKITENK